jgi:hypothetical protein
VLPTSMPRAAENRGLMMPTRRQTRAQERATRVSWERGINRARIAAEAARRAERIAASYEPPTLLAQLFSRQAATPRVEWLPLEPAARRFRRRLP